MVKAACKLKVCKHELYQKKLWSSSPRSPPRFYTPLRPLALVLYIQLHEFINSSCNGHHQIFILCKAFWGQISIASTINGRNQDLQQLQCAARGNFLRRGDMCRTCFPLAELQVATHVIRCHQLHMLSVLESALTATRTLAHRIVFQDCHY